ncbi:hypothetical protein PAESOLCIP111_04019 [Paenibacillus solanacearum]|uniref:Family 2 glycosyl transferase n=1 Tax=Paenibacillus solanacearum TaxID=2048548 RepID=A0A916K6I5_9BACL|nr:hypothetical protein [Paenibacillus solanacearum]CAG7639194.1 hypothetical protein PAESOLCIP111_04019 [Paenibacillus solanacearum]
MYVTMKRRMLLGLAALVLLGGAAVYWSLGGGAGWLSSGARELPPPAVPVYTEQGIKQTTAVKDGRLQVYDGTGWKPEFWTGVNMGATTPGHAPGELAPTQADYLRWFAQIKDMNADVVRVYTILPPFFYEALAEFNAGRKDPLYILQGVWSPEEHLIGADGGGQDAFQEDAVAVFQQEIQDAVGAVHGKLKRKAKAGHASGKYTADVSPYVLGWVVGTEWEPYAVQATNDAHPGMPPFQGEYFQASAGASPFESWLAQMLDTLAKEESKHGWQHPVSFTNWVTTDPLRHPNEPAENEDLVSVDPMHIKPKDNWKAGYFASYHIYPYYPDLLRYEEKYQTYRDSRGEVNPYAGYLRDLRQHHQGIPLIVAEYGVPSSRGMAHYGPLGRNQGLHTEREQGEIDADLYRSIYDENYDGAMLFAWQDEWFKITWNTMELDAPIGRRPYWRNMLTNEEHFGVLAVEAGASPEDQIVLDGKTDDWERRKGTKTQSYPGFDMTVSHDEAYVYLLLRKKEGAWKPGDETVYVGFDTLEGGSAKADQAPGVTFGGGQEFVLKLQGEEDSAIYVNSAYDIHTWQYGFMGKMMPWQEAWKQAENGLFLPYRLPVSKPQVLPQTGEKLPFEDVELGALHHGTTDPNRADFNNLADWYASGPVMEVRLPWMLLGFTDPSTKKAWRYPYEAGALKSEEVKAIRVEPHVSGPAAGTGASAPMAYKWDAWNKPAYHERLKQSYPILQEAFGELQNQPPKGTAAGADRPAAGSP